MSTYTLQQQAFTLALMSGDESGQKDSAAELAKKLARKIDYRMAAQGVIDLIGQWTRAWGPAVWESTVPIEKGFTSTAPRALECRRQCHVCGLQCSLQWTPDCLCGGRCGHQLYFNV